MSILFVGNSHTGGHDLPYLVRGMILHQRPEARVYAHYAPVGFLDETVKGSYCRRVLNSGPWTHVVLQAQKISMSGRFHHSRREGIDTAKAAKKQGASVIFYAEWGRAGVEGDGRRQAKIYGEMADAAGVDVAPVPAAWDLALTERPGMKLHASDGNHQSALGAFLTACVLTAGVTGESPVGLADFPHKAASESDRRFLAGVAERAISQSAAR